MFINSSTYAPTTVYSQLLLRVQKVSIYITACGWSTGITAAMCSFFKNIHYIFNLLLSTFPWHLPWRITALAQSGAFFFFSLSWDSSVRDWNTTLAFKSDGDGRHLSPSPGPLSNPGWGVPAAEARGSEDTSFLIWRCDPSLHLGNGGEKRMEEQKKDRGGGGGGM